MKGFTLIELLAVIVILAIILVIAVPHINKTITDSQKKSFESDAKIVLSQLDINTLDKSLDILGIDETNIKSILGIKDDNYESIKIMKVNGSPYILVKGKNKWNGLMAYGTYNNMTVSTDTTYNTILSHMGYNSIKGVNEPVLSKGMTPIKWDGSKWINTTEDDIDWYDYTNKEWANVKTTDGSMWVWIPRYIYKITSGWHSSTTGTIEVKFSMGIDDTIDNTVTLDTGTTSNASNNKWTNHPGFTFGNIELTGIWVAKFEATAVEGVGNSATLDDVTTKTIKIIPNATSWRNISMNSVFTVVRNMETKGVYGWDMASTLNSDGTYTTDTNNVDTHLIKNVEWGTAAYLSKSVYGKNTIEVYGNNSTAYITGCARIPTSYDTFNGCQNTYDSENGLLASTTGNIYGIYDMSGNSWDSVAAYLNSGHVNLTTYGVSIVNADIKYKDVYQSDSLTDSTINYALAIQKKGDAIYETSGNISGGYAWYSDYSYIPINDTPWFWRGGGPSYGGYSGVFMFSYVNGSAYSGRGFRPVLLVYNGL